MPDSNGSNNNHQKGDKGIAKLNKNNVNNHFDYPIEAYMEDFEIETINTLKILKNFKPINTDKLQ